MKDRLKGSMYKENRIGPRMVPWGTPPVFAAEEEENHKSAQKMSSLSSMR